MMNAEELLNKAIEILAGGSNWVKYDNAVDVDGKFCPIHSKKAVKWDIYGALRRAHYESGNRSWKPFHEAYETAKKNIPQSFRNRDIEDWNDFGDFKSAISILTGGAIPPDIPDEIIQVIGTEDGFIFFTDSQALLLV